MRSLILGAILVGALSVPMSATAATIGSSGDVTLDFLNDLGTPGHDSFDASADVGTPPIYQVYREQSKVLSASDAAIATAGNNGDIAPGGFAEGLRVVSYFFHMDNGVTSSSGTVTFGSDILGVYTDAGIDNAFRTAGTGLYDTDPVFGFSNVVYGQSDTADPRDISTFRGTLEQEGEIVRILADGRTIEWITLNGGNDGLEQFRVVVAATNVPIPASGLLLLTALGAVAGLRARRRTVG